MKGRRRPATGLEPSQGVPIVTLFPRSIPRVLMAAFLVGTPMASQAMTQDEIALLKGPDRQKILEAGAAKEGEVMFYSGMIVNQALRPIADGFQQKYPNVKAQFWRGQTSEILQKVLAEIRAKNQYGDVIEWGGGTIAAVKANAVAPFHSPESDAYDKNYWDSARGFWGGTRMSYFGLAYNTRQVAEKDVPKAFDDLLDPKWKDKLAWPIAETGHQTFIANLMISRGQEKAEEYLKKLAQNRIVAFTPAARALVDRVGQGEYPLGVNIYAHHPLISKEQGAPLDVAMQEPIPSNLSSVQLIRGAPHPHAAMLLIDFIMSKKGHEILRDADYLPSRLDVDLPQSLRKIVPGLTKQKETVFTPEALFDSLDKSQALYQKYFSY